ncbi:MAG: PIN domain-containing protein [Bauldia sp.]|nr:MAG: PIN domain-containing protein [Bauldia sp.]MBZ0226877.1 PIN domain-containing protein [Bauldia sp.]
MAATAVVDTGFLVALLRDRDIHRDWAAAMAAEFPTPWHTCEAVLAETFHLLSPHARPAIAELLNLRALLVSFSFRENQSPVLGLMQKYAALPADLADACIVRMSELLSDPVVLTTDDHFRVYRRHSRHVIPCRLPD